MMQENEFSIKEYLDNLYENKSGYVRYADGEREAYAEKNVFVTYSEMLYDGWEKLIEMIDVREDDVFYDLGSGIGKTCMQWFLEQPVKKVCGIEAMKVRHNIAESCLKQAKKDLPQFFTSDKEISFIKENFLDVDFSDATIVYMCATCFSPELMEKLGNIMKEFKNLRYILSFKSIPSWPETKELTLECSWGDGTCRLYSLK